MHYIIIIIVIIIIFIIYVLSIIMGINKAKHDIPWYTGASEDETPGEHDAKHWRPSVAFVSNPQNQ